MESKRFEIETGCYLGKDRPIIYDEEGLDDYYFCGDYRDFKSLCDLLNEQDQEIKCIRNTINDLYETERTSLGKSVLKQLKEAIGL